MVTRFEAALGREIVAVGAFLYFLARLQDALAGTY